MHQQKTIQSAESSKSRGLVAVAYAGFSKGRGQKI